MSLSGLESDSNTNSLSSSDRDVSSDSQDEDRYSAESDEDDVTATAKPPDGTVVGSTSVLAVDVLDLLDQVMHLLSQTETTQ